jgi:diguanylate cyclase (GGDEF)-like protein
MRGGRQGRLHPAQHDALTGLAHRGLGHARLEAGLEAASASGATLAVVMLDLERFQALNAALGYAVGDRVLQEVARRLARFTGPRDTAARFGSDEFVVLLARSDAAAALRDVDRLSELLAREVEVDGLRIPVRARAGVALHPAHGTDAATLLRRADLALQQAREAACAIQVYENGQDERQLRRLAIVHALRDAVAGQQLRLEYQPKLDLRTRSITQAEALLRWRHPAVGALPPDEFIPLAEQSGQIQPLTRWVLDEVLRQACEWKGEGLTLGVAVNLSALDLSALDLPAALGQLLARHGIEPRRLTLEITESALMRHPAEGLGVLVQLKGLGVRLSLDDFGVGFSSLSRLRQLPVDELKIDRSFVLGLRGGSTDAVFVRSIIELGHRLGLRVVAEGVEEAAALQLLEELGCDVVQGYVVSPPLAPALLAEFCRARRGGRRTRAAQSAVTPRTRSASP